MWKLMLGGGCGINTTARSMICDSGGFCSKKKDFVGCSLLWLRTELLECRQARLIDLKRT